ncbi:MAG: 4Fe-4S dicluster domain-containing protein [Deltaproteobacteria bacterium]|nr:4Fe-4S dicluster domain-containing protein [Deltaproteobacteria bacterium]
MPYIITNLCVNDGACVEVCPVACIHTKPGAPQFYIDPEVCIDCEQCEIVCPVKAIFKDIDIPAEHQPSIEVNAAFFRQNKAAIGPVPFDTALAMIESAQDYARMVGAAVTAVVVDEAGVPIAVGKMDKAEPQSAELAFDKAYTAAAFHVATATLVPQARQPLLRSLLIAHRGKILPMAGAIPVLNGVTIIGAIGVAGSSRPEQDALCCRAALNVWESPGH